MNKRNKYLDLLIATKDKKQIKVITGVRRSGKSTLLELFSEYLRDSGVADESILEMNFELLKFDNIQDYKALNNYVMQRICMNGKTYLLLDEIGKVREWEKVVASLQADKSLDVDIYITGSNATLLSSDLSILIGGRYLEIRMLPLSFSEYCDFVNAIDQTSIDSAYYNFTRYGGFPGILDMGNDKKLIDSFLDGIYNSILIKDVVSRNAVRDIDLLERVLKFICANIGKPVSAKKISDYLTSMGRKASHETVDSYLRMLADSFIIYKVRNYDIKGKQFLANLGKYFLVDIGMRNFLIGEKGDAIGSTLENLVFSELMYRGYNISVGRYGEYEVDFVAEKNLKYVYIQVTTSMLDETVRERELRPFAYIKDHYPKVVITADKSPFNDYDGVRAINIVDFISGKKL
jgi:predicted AAA+ superfamily ATPase